MVCKRKLPAARTSYPVPLTDLAETQRVLGILLAACTRCAFCRIAHTGRGVGDSAACALGCVAYGACQAFGGVAQSVSYPANCSGSVIGNRQRKEG